NISVGRGRARLIDTLK
nr:Chain F, Protein argonaute-3 [Drosophila melanogaster]7CFC_G Chain G, Protein argonaute-3 [Drosophila melanogaster]7CFC_H Chain H, Protein argonaute-3 [Drosophila melanogaster]7CFC_I Chain I, Protein argonaute-3 [Drosophila melanogaster]